MIKAIIFDVWGTLGKKHCSLSRALQKHFKIRSYNAFLPRYEKSVQRKRYWSRKALAKTFLNEFKIKDTKEDINFIVSETKKGVQGAEMFLGTRNLLASLHQNYKLGILSNSTYFDSQVVKKWKIGNLFHSMVFSWQTGHIKPQKRSFEAICAKLKTKPKETLFVDDLATNVRAAKKFGFKVIKYTGLKDLKKQLKKYRIKV